MTVYSTRERTDRMRSRCARFLARPKVRVLLSHDGRPEAVLVRFRPAAFKGLGAVEPYEHALVDLFLDADYLPVSILLLERVTGPALVGTVEGILRLARRRKGRARPWDEDTLSLVLRGLFLGNEKAPGTLRFPAGAETIPA